MRVQFPSRAYSLPIDRYADRVLEYYNEIGVSPHTATSRVSYTVPTGYMLEVDMIACRMVRQSVATVPNRMQINITVYPGGGTGIPVIRREAIAADLYEGIVFELTGPVYFVGDDIISIYTEDYSTGGSTRITIALLGFTFRYV